MEQSAREKKCMMLAEKWVKELNYFFNVSHIIRLDFLRESVYNLLLKV